MVPHMDKQDREKVVRDYLKIIDSEQPSDDAIIKRDRNRLRKLVSKQLWLKKQQK
jgi:hypothetical protein